ncbi:MAG: hypothetical protein N4A33_13335 [Bacteriovoracaceae bacterium]|jgi:hypothetical protein|nr:hypothetical protein [Bacteriovoracaceae bacterium]
MKRSLLLSVLIFIASCAQVTSLNMQRHEFGLQPNKIIWLQIAGFTEEHLALLKYDYETTQNTSYFEKFTCYGKAWDYNLYKLRPSSYEGFFSQITGKKNIRSSCDDFSQKPFWSYFEKQSFSTGVFETQMTKAQSIYRPQCKQNKEFLKTATVWKMQKSSNDKDFFHAETKQFYEEDKVYYDKSCYTGECFTQLDKNIASVHSMYKSGKNRYNFIVRDFSFKKAIESNNFTKAKDILSKLNKLVFYFQDYVQTNRDTLFLVTSAATKDISFPKQGKQWKEYKKKSKYIRSQNGNLISTVMAYGARAENFCGMYDNGDIVSRIFAGPKQQGLEMKFVNPFK